MFSLGLIGENEHIASTNFKEFGVFFSGSIDADENGFNFIERVLPDIIICDIDTPLANGFEIIEKIKKIPGYNPEIIILTAYDDFFHAKMAIQFHISSYLTKPVIESEFLLALSHAVDMCNSRRDFMCQREEYIANKSFAFVERLVHETLIPTSELDRAGQELGLSLDAESYICVMAYIPDYEEVSFDQKAEVQRAFCSEFENAMSSYFIDKRIYFLLPCSTEDYDKIIKGCKDLLKMFNKFRLFFCISDFATSVTGTKTIARHAKECRRYAFSHTHSSVFVYDAVNEYFDSAEFSKDVASLKAAARDVNIINMTEWHNKIDDVSAKVKKLVYFDPDFIKTVVYNMMSSVIGGVIASFTASSKEQPKDDALWLNITSAVSFEDLFLRCHDIANTFSNFMSVSIPQRNKALSEFMKNYITKNYMHSTTIASLSKLTYISPNYLSKIFLSENGISFKHYLKQYRMERAKEFILSGKYKIYQVSLLVGYKDVKKFRKAFIEYHGTSPGSLLA